VALAAAMAVAQRRFMALHQSYGRRLLAAQDEERAAVAREVHDDAVQRLAILRHELSLLESEGGVMTEAQHRRLAGLEGEIGDLSDSLRQLAHRLHPATLDYGHLGLAFEQLAEEMDRVHGVEVALDAADAGLVRNPAQALALFRIAQESLRNVARHASSRQARLSVRRDDGGIVMLVEDTGRGFDPEAGRKGGATGNGGLGLYTIRERARLAGGEATITARPGAGTTVRVTLPPGEETRRA